MKVIQEELGNTAGLDPLNDRLKVGYVQAYSDLLNISFGDIEND